MYFFCLFLISLIVFFYFLSNKTPSLVDNSTLLSFMVFGSVKESFIQKYICWMRFLTCHRNQTGNLHRLPPPHFVEIFQNFGHVNAMHNIHKLLREWKRQLTSPAFCFYGDMWEWVRVLHVSLSLYKKGQNGSDSRRILGFSQRK